MDRAFFSPGDPVPWFSCRSPSNPKFHFETAAGRYIVLTFLGSSSLPASEGVLRGITGALRERFDDERICFFGVSTDPRDEHGGALKQLIPGIRFFFDSTCAVSQGYGALPLDTSAMTSPADVALAYQPMALVLDPFLRVIANLPLFDPDTHLHELAAVLDSLPPVNDHAGVPIHAPVLVLPRVFEPEFCQELIAHYTRNGGQESGFMREQQGRTVGMLDPTFKRRSDFSFEAQPEYEDLRAAIRHRLIRRLLPEIRKVFQFNITRIERYIVACYDGDETGGFFRAHRDNTTKGTAHRRFACTINLNAEDYDGGDLRFPEFGTHTYRAPTGGAVIFSCSLLHEARPVTRGKRYAFLPFLYDDAAARIRDANRQFIGQEEQQAS